MQLFLNQVIATHFNMFKDWASIDLISRCLIFKWAASKVFDLKIGHLDSSPRYGHQGGIPLNEKKND